MQHAWLARRLGRHPDRAAGRHEPQTTFATWEIPAAPSASTGVGNDAAEPTLPPGDGVADSFSKVDPGAESDLVAEPPHICNQRGGLPWARRTRPELDQLRGSGGGSHQTEPPPGFPPPPA